MRLKQLIEKFQLLKNETKDKSLKKSISKVLSLIMEIEKKDISQDEKDRIQTSINPYLKNINTHKEFKLSLKKLREILTKDFGFVPTNYYLSLGIGFGLALGTSLGISIGVGFHNGIVFGPMIGSGIGLIVGLIAGVFLDKNKENEKRTLKNL